MQSGWNTAEVYSEGDVIKGAKKRMTDRDANGRFIKGKKGGPGRPPKATEAEYLDALKDILPLERFQRIVDSYARRAEKGDTRAAEVLFKYVLPNVNRIDVTTKDQSLNTITIKGVDYRTAIANLAPRSMGDSDTSSEGEDPDDGSAVG